MTKNEYEKAIYKPIKGSSPEGVRATIPTPP